MKRKKRMGKTGAAPSINSATNPEVERYAETENITHGPSIEDFRLDLASNGLASAWNHRAIQIFTESFLDTHEFACRDEEDIAAAFKTHITTLRIQYRKFVSPGEPAGVSADKARQGRRIAVRTDT
jgi:hypothetical protein